MVSQGEIGTELKEPNFYHFFLYILQYAAEEKMNKDFAQTMGACYAIITLFTHAVLIPFFSSQEIIIVICL